MKKRNKLLLGAGSSAVIAGLVSAMSANPTSSTKTIADGDFYTSSNKNWVKINHADDAEILQLKEYLGLSETSFLEGVDGTLWDEIMSWKGITGINEYAGASFEETMARFETLLKLNQYTWDGTNVKLLNTWNGDNAGTSTEMKWDKWPGVSNNDFSNLFDGLKKFKELYISLGYVDTQEELDKFNQLSRNIRLYYIMNTQAFNFNANSRGQATQLITGYDIIKGAAIFGHAEVTNNVRSSSFIWWLGRNFATNNNRTRPLLDYSSGISQFERFEDINYKGDIKVNSNGNSMPAEIYKGATEYSLYGFLNYLAKVNNLNVKDANVQEMLKSLFKFLYSIIKAENFWSDNNSAGYARKVWEANNSNSAQEAVKSVEHNARLYTAMSFSLKYFGEFAKSFEKVLNDAALNYAKNPTKSLLETYTKLLLFFQQNINPTSRSLDFNQEWSMTTDINGTRNREAITQLLAEAVPNFGSITLKNHNFTTDGITAYLEPNKLSWTEALNQWKAANGNKQPSTKEEWESVKSVYKKFYEDQTIEGIFKANSTTNSTYSLETLYLANKNITPEPQYGIGLVSNALYYTGKATFNNEVAVDTQSISSAQNYKSYITGFNESNKVPVAPIISQYSSYTEYKTDYESYLNKIVADETTYNFLEQRLTLPQAPELSTSFDDANNRQSFYQLNNKYLDIVDKIVKINRKARNIALEKIVSIPLLENQDLNVDRAKIVEENGKKYVLVGLKGIRLEENDIHIIWEDATHTKIKEILPGINASEVDIKDPTSKITLRNSLIRKLNETALEDYTQYAQALSSWYSANKPGLTTEQIAKYDQQIKDILNVKNSDISVLDGYEITHQTTAVITNADSEWDNITIPTSKGNGATNSTKLLDDKAKSAFFKAFDFASQVKKDYEADVVILQNIHDYTVDLIKNSIFETSTTEFDAKLNQLQTYISKPEIASGFPTQVNYAKQVIEAAKNLFYYSRYTENKTSGQNYLPNDPTQPYSFDSFINSQARIDNVEFRNLLAAKSVVYERKRFEKVKFTYKNADSTAYSIDKTNWTSTAKNWFNTFYNNQDPDTALFITDKDALVSAVDTLYTTMDQFTATTSQDKNGINGLDKDLDKVLVTGYLELAKKYNSASLTLEKMEIQNVNIQALKATKAAIMNFYNNPMDSVNVNTANDANSYYIIKNGQVVVNENNTQYQLIKVAQEKIAAINPNIENGKYAVIKRDYNSYISALAALGEFIEIEELIENRNNLQGANGLDYGAFNKKVWEEIDKELVVWTNRLDNGWRTGIEREWINDQSKSINDQAPLKNKSTLDYQMIDNVNEFLGINNSDIRNILVNKIYYLQYLANFSYIKQNLIPHIDFNIDPTTDLNYNADILTKGLTTLNNKDARGQVAIALRADDNAQQKELLDSLKEMYVVLKQPHAAKSNSKVVNTYGNLQKVNQYRTAITNVDGVTDEMTRVNSNSTINSQLSAFLEELKIANSAAYVAKNVPVAKYFETIKSEATNMLNVHDAKNGYDNTALNSSDSAKEKHYHLNAYTQSDINNLYARLTRANQLFKELEKIVEKYELNKENVSGKNVETYWKEKVSKQVYNDYITTRTNAQKAIGGAYNSNVAQLEYVDSNGAKQTFDLTQLNTLDKNVADQKIQEFVLKYYLGNKSELANELQVAQDALTSALQKENDAKLQWEVANSGSDDAAKNAAEQAYNIAKEATVRAREAVKNVQSKEIKGIYDAFTTAVNNINEQAVSADELKDLIAELQGSSYVTDGYKVVNTASTNESVYGLNPNQFTNATVKVPTSTINATATQSKGLVNFGDASTDLRNVNQNVDDPRYPDIDYSKIFTNGKYTNNYEYYIENPTDILGSGYVTNQYDMNLLTKTLSTKMTNLVYQAIYWANLDNLLITKTISNARIADTNNSTLLKQNLQNSYEAIINSIKLDQNYTLQNVYYTNNKAIDSSGKIPLWNLENRIFNNLATEANPTTKSGEMFNDMVALYFAYINATDAEKHNFDSAGYILETLIKLSTATDTNGREAYIRAYKTYVDARNALSGKESIVTGDIVDYLGTKIGGLWDQYVSVVKKFVTQNNNQTWAQKSAAVKALANKNNVLDTDKKLVEQFTIAEQVLMTYFNLTIDQLGEFVNNNQTPTQANKKEMRLYSQKELDAVAKELYIAINAKESADSKDKVTLADNLLKISEKLTQVLNENSPIKDKYERLKDLTAELRAEITAGQKFSDINNANYDAELTKKVKAFEKLLLLSAKTLEYIQVLVDSQNSTTNEDLIKSYLNKLSLDTSTINVLKWKDILGDANSGIYGQYTTEIAKEDYKLSTDELTQLDQAGETKYQDSFTTLQTALNNMFATQFLNEKENNANVYQSIVDAKDALEKWVNANNSADYLDAQGNKDYAKLNTLIIDAFNKYNALVATGANGFIDQNQFNVYKNQLSSYIYILLSMFKIQNLVIDESDAQTLKVPTNFTSKQEAITHLQNEYTAWFTKLDALAQTLGSWNTALKAQHFNNLKAFNNNAKRKYVHALFNQWKVAIDNELNAFEGQNDYIKITSQYISKIRQTYKKFTTSLELIDVFFNYVSAKTLESNYSEEQANGSTIQTHGINPIVNYNKPNSETVNLNIGFINWEYDGVKLSSQQVDSFVQYVSLLNGINGVYRLTDSYDTISEDTGRWGILNYVLNHPTLTNLTNAAKITLDSEVQELEAKIKALETQYKDINNDVLWNAQTHSQSETLAKSNYNSLVAKLNNLKVTTILDQALLILDEKSEINQLLANPDFAKLFQKDDFVSYSIAQELMIQQTKAKVAIKQLQALFAVRKFVSEPNEANKLSAQKLIEEVNNVNTKAIFDSFTDNLEDSKVIGKAFSNVYLDAYNFILNQLFNIGEELAKLDTLTTDVQKNELLDKIYATVDNQDDADELGNRTKFVNTADGRDDVYDFLIKELNVGELKSAIRRIVEIKRFEIQISQLNDLDFTQYTASEPLVVAVDKSLINPVNSEDLKVVARLVKTMKELQISYNNFANIDNLASTPLTSIENVQQKYTIFQQSLTNFLNINQANLSHSEVHLWEKILNSANAINKETQVVLALDTYTKNPINVNRAQLMMKLMAYDNKNKDLITKLYVVKISADIINSFWNAEKDIISVWNSKNSTQNTLADALELENFLDAQVKKNNAQMSEQERAKVAQLLENTYKEFLWLIDPAFQAEFAQKHPDKVVSDAEFKLIESNPTNSEETKAKEAAIEKLVAYAQELSKKLKVTTKEISAHEKDLITKTSNQSFENTKLMNQLRNNFDRIQAQLRVNDLLDKYTKFNSLTSSEIKANQNSVISTGWLRKLDPEDKQLNALTEMLDIITNLQSSVDLIVSGGTYAYLNSPGTTALANLAYSGPTGSLNIFTKYAKADASGTNEYYNSEILANSYMRLDAFAKDIQLKIQGLNLLNETLNALATASSDVSARNLNYEGDKYKNKPAYEVFTLKLAELKEWLNKNNPELLTKDAENDYWRAFKASLEFIGIVNEPLTKLNEYLNSNDSNSSDSEINDPLYKATNDSIQKLFLIPEQDRVLINKNAYQSEGSLLLQQLARKSVLARATTKLIDYHNALSQMGRISFIDPNYKNDAKASELYASLTQIAELFLKEYGSDSKNDPNSAYGEGTVWNGDILLALGSSPARVQTLKEATRIIQNAILSNYNYERLVDQFVLNPNKANRDAMFNKAVDSAYAKMQADLATLRQFIETNEANPDEDGVISASMVALAKNILTEGQGQYQRFNLIEALKVLTSEKTDLSKADITNVKIDAPEIKDNLVINMKDLIGLDDHFKVDLNKDGSLANIAIISPNGSSALTYLFLAKDNPAITDGSDSKNDLVYSGFNYDYFDRIQRIIAMWNIYNTEPNKVKETIIEANVDNNEVSLEELANYIKALNRDKTAVDADGKYLNVDGVDYNYEKLILDQFNRFKDQFSLDKAIQEFINNPTDENKAALEALKEKVQENRKLSAANPEDEVFNEAEKALFDSLDKLNEARKALDEYKQNPTDENLEKLAQANQALKDANNALESLKDQLSLVQQPEADDLMKKSDSFELQAEAIKLASDYAKDPSVANGNALNNKLNELKQFIENNNLPENSQEKVLYDQLKTAKDVLDLVADATNSYQDKDNTDPHLADKIEAAQKLIEELKTNNTDDPIVQQLIAKAQENLDQLNKELEVDKALGQFLDSLENDDKEDLLQKLEEADMPQERKDDIKKIVEGGDKLAELDKLIDQYNKGELELTPEEFAQKVNELKNAIQQMADDAQASPNLNAIEKALAQAQLDRLVVLEAEMEVHKALDTLVDAEKALEEQIKDLAAAKSENADPAKIAELEQKVADAKQQMNDAKAKADEAINKAQEANKNYSEKLAQSGLGQENTNTDFVGTAQDYADAIVDLAGEYEKFANDPNNYDPSALDEIEKAFDKMAEIKESYADKVAQGKENLDDFRNDAKLVQSLNNFLDNTNATNANAFKDQVGLTNSVDEFNQFADKLMALDKANTTLNDDLSPENLANINGVIADLESVVVAIDNMDKSDWTLAQHIVAEKIKAMAALKLAEAEVNKAYVEYALEPNAENKAKFDEKAQALKEAITEANNNGFDTKEAQKLYDKAAILSNPNNDGLNDKVAQLFDKLAKGEEISNDELETLRAQVIAMPNDKPLAAAREKLLEQLAKLDAQKDAIELARDYNNIKEKENAIDELKDQLVDVDFQIEQLKAKENLSPEEQAKLAELEAQQGALKDQIANKEAELAKSKEDLIVNKKANLEAQNAKLNEQLDAEEQKVQAEKLAHEEQLANLEKALNDALNTANEKTDELKIAQEELTKAKDKLTKDQEALKELEKEKLLAEINKANLEKELADEQAKDPKDEAKIKALQDKIAEAEKQLSDLTQAIEDQKAVVADDLGLIANLENQVNNAQAELNKAQKDAQDAQKAVEKVKEQIALNDEQLANIAKAKADAKEQLAKGLADVEKLENYFNDPLVQDSEAILDILMNNAKDLNNKENEANPNSEHNGALKDLLDAYKQADKAQDAFSNYDKNPSADTKAQFDKAKADFDALKEAFDKLSDEAKANIPQDLKNKLNQMSQDLEHQEKEANLKDALNNYIANPNFANEEAFNKALEEAKELNDPALNNLIKELQDRKDLAKALAKAEADAPIDLPLEDINKLLAQIEKLDAKDPQTKALNDQLLAKAQEVKATVQKRLAEEKLNEALKATSAEDKVSQDDLNNIQDLIKDAKEKGLDTKAYEATYDALKDLKDLDDVLKALDDAVDKYVSYKAFESDTPQYKANANKEVANFNKLIQDLQNKLGQVKDSDKYPLLQDTSWNIKDKVKEVEKLFEVKDNHLQFVNNLMDVIVNNDANALAYAFNDYVLNNGEYTPERVEALKATQADWNKYMKLVDMLYNNPNELSESNFDELRDVVNKLAANEAFDNITRDALKAHLENVIEQRIKDVQNNRWAFRIYLSCLIFLPIIGLVFLLPTFLFLLAKRRKKDKKALEK